MHETTLTAENLCAWCATTPGMSVFQPMAVSALELCRAAANLAENNKLQKLAAFAVEETEKLITQLGPLPLSPEIVHTIEFFETKLDEIRRSIEKTPARSKNKAKLVIEHVFNRDTSRQKAELKCISHALLQSSDNSSPTLRIRREYVLELASFSTRTAVAICDAPALNFLKPIVGIAEIICDTAKTVRSNHDAALELVKHSSAVTKAIVDHAASLDVAEATDGEGLEPLKSALEDIRLYLTPLQKPYRRPTRWIMANQDKNRMVQLNLALDKALAIFTSANVLDAQGELRTLVGLNSDLKETLTIIHADLARIVTKPEGEDQDRRNEEFSFHFGLYHNFFFYIS
ncbi:hypothetical protein MSAN_01046100 [Mycena sanguinolenta]|uniref:Uncharacterized protein n=1 Tax=Mycena sanguinolenta TaxID=230812 RepID=A0A8H7D9Q0_9AGAR|nr:hypothetical protein MSAN_01046100 [Mycena sanguinolenta]